MFMFVIAFLALSFLSDGLLAQDTNPGTPDVKIPFIDRDGDGINDLLQHGWGLRFMEQYKKRQLVWEQLNVEIIKDEEGLMVDTDGDGVGDISIRDFLKEKMDTLIDTDGDGTPDTALKDFLGRRFKAFDKDGDGILDEISKEELKQMMQKMKEWRKEIGNRIRQGLPPFVDENGDGIPDNLPEGFRWRGFKKGGN